MKSLFLFLLILISTSGQWTELEVRRMLLETNERHAQIEKMTKEAAIRYNQMNPEGQSLSSGRGTPLPPLEPPIPAPAPPPPPLPTLPNPSVPRTIIRPAPPPTIEDDRTFLAKMSEQEALVNQLNALATRDAVTRNGLLVMESAFLNALRPLTMPFLGQPIPGHFVPFQRMQQRPIEQSPIDNHIEIQQRPPISQLPMRNSEIIDFQLNGDQIAEEVIRNETATANY